MSLLSADLYPEFVAGLDASVDYQRDGFVRVAETEAEAEALARDAREQSTVAGVKVEMMDGGAIRALEPALSPRVRAGNFCAQDGNVDPLKLVRAVARAARRHGARLLDHRDGIRAPLTRDGAAIDCAASRAAAQRSNDTTRILVRRTSRPSAGS